MSTSARLFNYILNISRLRGSSLISGKLIRQLSNKDVGFVKSTSTSNDLLLHSLRNASSQKNVLELVSDHHKIMNNKHLMQALRSIFNLQKSGNSDISPSDLMTDPSFKTLCLTLKSQSRSIDLRDTIEALKVVSYVGIPSNSTITQVLLQLIRHNVNQLTLQQIIFLDYIVKQFKSTPLSDALLIALPIVFEVNLPVKMDTENITQLSDVLQYVSRKHFAEETVDMILDAIMKHRNLDAKTAMSVVWSLCDLKPSESYTPLLNKSIKTLIKNGESIKFSDLETTLTKLAQRTNVYQPYYYNERFFNIVADIAIDRDLGFQQALWIQQKFNKVGHLHRGLIDYIAFKCNVDDTIISNLSQNSLFSLISAFSLTEYKPKLNWELVKNNIESNKHLDFIHHDSDWLRFATRLAILDIYIPRVLKKAFCDDNIDRISRHGTYDECKYFITLYQTILSTQHDLKDILPPFNSLKGIIEQYQSLNTQDNVLQGALEKAFGGKQYILTECSTRQGIDIHHAIVMRKGGFPVSFSSTDRKYPIILEDLECPTDSKVVAILGLNASSYCLNGFELRGINTVAIRALEASGYAVVVIPVQRWTQMSDHEKIPYLMRAIREKSDNLEEIQAEI